MLVDDILNCIFFNGHCNDSSNKNKSEIRVAFNNKISPYLIMNLYSQFIIKNNNNDYILYDKILFYLLTYNSSVDNVSNFLSVESKIVDKIARTIKLKGESVEDILFNENNIYYHIIYNKFSKENLLRTNYDNIEKSLKNNGYNLVKTANELNLYVTDLVQKLLKKSVSYLLPDDIKNNILNQYVDYIISIKGTNLEDLPLQAISYTIGTADFKTFYKNKVNKLYSYC